MRWWHICARSRRSEHGASVVRMEILCRRGGRGDTVRVHPTTSRIGETDDGPHSGNLPAAATHDVAARCLLAIELSKKSWVVAASRPACNQNCLATRAFTSARALFHFVATRAMGGKQDNPTNCGSGPWPPHWRQRSIKIRLVTPACGWMSTPARSIGFT
jgi:hypothetical protein